MTPIWTVAADGQDISDRLAAYLVSLSVTDQDGMESDELAIEVADPAAQIALPRLGAILTVAIGYAHSGPVPMGRYAVDGVELATPPRALAIRAHAADLRGSLKTRETKGWEATTLGAIVAAIASKHSLTPSVAADLAGQSVPRQDQTNESDISFLTRLGQTYDALVSIKQDHLIMTRRGQGRTASGAPIPEVALLPADATAWRIALSDADRYTAVEARYRDLAQAKDLWTRAGAAAGKTAGDGVYRLRPTFPDQARAQAAADAKLAALARGNTALSLTLPGRTDLAAETPLLLTGFDKELDGRWIVTSATHRIDSAGYVVSLEGERAQ